MNRQVIYLPKQEHEENYKVELLIGKTLVVDCNRHMIGGTLETKPCPAGVTTTWCWRSCLNRPRP